MVSVSPQDFNLIVQFLNHWAKSLGERELFTYVGFFFTSWWLSFSRTRIAWSTDEIQLSLGFNGSLLAWHFLMLLHFNRLSLTQTLVIDFHKLLRILGWFSPLISLDNQVLNFLAHILRCRSSSFPKKKKARVNFPAKLNYYIMLPNPCFTVCILSSPNLALSW